MTDANEAVAAPVAAPETETVAAAPAADTVEAPAAEAAPVEAEPVVAETPAVDPATTVDAAASEVTEPMAPVADEHAKTRSVLEDLKRLEIVHALCDGFEELKAFAEKEITALKAKL